MRRAARHPGRPPGSGVGWGPRRGTASASPRPRTPPACATPSGVALPVGLPAAFTDPVERPLDDLVARFARTHGPFLTEQVGRRPRARRPSGCAPVLERLEAEGRVVRGEFRPDGVAREWCDDDVLRQLRRRSLAALRQEVEPVDEAALGRFLPAWQGVGLAAAARASTAWSRCSACSRGRRCRRRCSRPTSSRPASRVPAGRPRRAVHRRRGGVGRRRRPRRRRRAGAPRLPRPGRRCSCRPPGDGFEPGPAPRGAARPPARRRARRSGPSWCGAVAAADLPYDDAEVLAALWDLVWAGLVTNDSLAPLRALGVPAGAAPATGRARGRRAGRAWRGSAGSARRPAPAGGRWSRRCSRRPPTPTEAAHARAEPAARALRRAHPRGGAGRGRSRAASPASTRCSRRSRSGAGCGAATSSPASAPPSSPCPAPSTGCARSAPGPRAATPRRPVVVLSAVDPAQPYGAALRWPERDRPAQPVRRRPRGAADGDPVAFLERGGHAVTTFPAAADRPDWPTGLVALLDRGRYRSIEIRTVDGVPIREEESVAAALASGRLDRQLQGPRPPGLTATPPSGADASRVFRARQHTGGELGADVEDRLGVAVDRRRPRAPSR